MIYNRLAARDAAPDRRHDALRDRQLHAAADRVAAATRRSPYNTGSTRACRRRRSTTRGWRRSRRPPIRRSTNYLYFVVKPCGNGEQVFTSTLRPVPGRRAAVPQARRAHARAPGGSAAPARSCSVHARLGVARLAGRPQPLAGDAERGARRGRAGGLALPAAAGPAGAVRRDRARRCRARAFAAPTSRSRTSRRRWRSPTDATPRARRDRRRQHADVRGRRRDRAPTTPTRPALIAALPFRGRGAHARSCSAPAAARAPPSGRCSTRARARCASGTALPSARAKLCAELGGDARGAVREPADLLVNCTPVGLDASEERVQAACRSMPMTLTRYDCVVDFVYRDTETPLVQAARARRVPRRRRARAARRARARSASSGSPAHAAPDRGDARGGRRAMSDARPHICAPVRGRPAEPPAAAQTTRRHAAAPPRRLGPVPDRRRSSSSGSPTGARPARDRGLAPAAASRPSACCSSSRRSPPSSSRARSPSATASTTSTSACSRSTWPPPTC